MYAHEKPSTPSTVTRESLFEQVWKTPMNRLAEQYGITGNGLAKICVRLGIPYPPRGYWSKKRAGRKVTGSRLPPANAGTPDSVTISPTPSVRLKKHPLPAVLARMQQLRNARPAFRISSRLSDPHPVIARWIAEHARRRQEAMREPDSHRRRYLDPGEYTAQDRRRHRLLDALLKVLENNGARAGQDDRGRVFVDLAGERIEFQLREKLKQVRHPLTEDEKRWYSSRKWRVELEPTGRLVFAISTFLQKGLRQEWLETEASPMESLLPEIAATLLEAGPLLADQSRKREEAERLWQAQRRREAEERERLALDAARWRRFSELAATWHAAKNTRVFLEALMLLPAEDGEIIAGKSIPDWLQWASEHLRKADLVNVGAAGVFRELEDVSRNI